MATTKMLHSSLILLLLAAASPFASATGSTATHDFGPDQPRYWPKYSGKRVVRLIDGEWEMGQMGSIEHPPPKSFDSMNPDLKPSDLATPRKTRIPSCVDNTPPGYLGYRGISFFRTYFDYDLTQAPARLLFQACSFYCRIWVNGVEIGDHRAGGYVAFFLNVPQQTSTSGGVLRGAQDHSNELVVLVDNRFNKTTAPVHEQGDYWHYSGIMRSVELHSMPPTKTLTWPWRLYAFPQDDYASVRLQLVLTDPTYWEEVAGSLSFDEGPSQSFVQPQAVDGTVDLGVWEVPNPRIWSIENPQLHVVAVDINGATVSERFGLRKFGIDPSTSRLTVNGRITKLVGWNHHTQFPASAASGTDQEMDDDIALLREGGTVFVRGSHYPQDPRWLDRLDEAGIVMWCETLGAGVGVHDTQDPYFMKHQVQQLNEMMDNALNHASIMLWAFFNEGPSNKKTACIGYETCAKVIKERDPTRLVTWASNMIDRDVCLHAADVVSFNAYPGWYGPRNLNPVDWWNKRANQVREGQYPGSKGKPLLISETGAAGIYEWSNNKTAARWTLAYQSKIISADVDVAIQNANISGITLWHFMDFKTFDNTENNTHCDYIPNQYPPTCAYINASAEIRRPGGLNHKGVVGFWRRKKPIFDIVAAKYNATRITNVDMELDREQIPS